MAGDPGPTVRDYIRAGGSGLIIGLPLLYTMEVWFHGFILSPWKILLLLGLGFVVVLGYNSVAGFRRERSIGELVIDSVSTIGLGIVIALVALLVLGRIDANTSISDAAGKVALEAIPIAFGASVATAQLSGDSGGAGSISPMARLGVGAGGALLFALNVAPTEEPMMLGIEASPWLLVAMVAVSLVVTFALVFLADFGGRQHKRGEDLLEHPWSETVTSYAVSIVVALFLLWSFGRTEGASVQAIAGMTVMLALVAAVGAAVARILIGGAHEGDAK
ncbi:MAG TPA: TIGR02587 family membrane protein [Candidatus Limnocylindrales bacterium]|nr:TIGR02587 family membrane protein [Candidatus Limnocylindrales bacterium]